MADLRPPGFAVFSDFFLGVFFLGEGLAMETLDEDG